MVPVPVLQVAMGDFKTAFENLVPSLTLKDLDRYDRLEQQYAPERQRAKGQGSGAATPGASSSSTAGASAAEAPSDSGASSSGALKLRPKLPPRRKSMSHAIEGL